MADVDQESKTEEATPRKLQQMREKGEVATSPDVAGAATVIAAIGTLAALAPTRAGEVIRFSQRTFRLRDVHRPFEAVEAFGALLVATIVPVAAAAAVAAIGVTLLQTRGVFALAKLQPKAENFDPINGLKKILPGPQMLTELGKSLLKVGLVAWLVYRLIAEELPRFSVLPSVEPEAAAAEVGRIAARLVMQGVALLAILAAGDYFIAWRRHQKQSRMEKHEVKQEHKESEGDPHLKGKRRARQREMAQARSVAQVKDATCLVTNPTHISVALRYEPDEGDGAPILLAQGVEEIALRMRTEARRHGIPIIENKPLARALKATGKVGRPIPIELYEVAARVIAHVMAIRTRNY